LNYIKLIFFSELEIMLLVYFFFSVIYLKQQIVKTNPNHEDTKQSQTLETPTDDNDEVIYDLGFLHDVEDYDERIKGMKSELQIIKDNNENHDIPVEIITDNYEAETEFI